jgi:hypothetical protein
MLSSKSLFKISRLIFLVGIAAVVLAIFLLLEKNSRLNEKKVQKKYNGPAFTAPNPFPNMPQVVVSSSSGGLSSPKPDWKAEENPVIQMDLDKL